MFDPVNLSHAEIVAHAISARSQITPQIVADGFLASLSIRRLDIRSALGSFAVLQYFPEHEFSARSASRLTAWLCSVCGIYHAEESQYDLNILNFERIKWGGARHDQPPYAAFDLEQFIRHPPPRPTPVDIRIFRELLEVIRRVPQETTSARLQKHLRGIMPSNKDERDVLIGILGLAGVLGTRAHPGYFKKFVPYNGRELPARRFVDMAYPACWWRGSDGINHEALGYYFGHIL